VDGGVIAPGCVHIRVDPEKTERGERSNADGFIVEIFPSLNRRVRLDDDRRTRIPRIPQHARRDSGQPNPLPIADPNDTVLASAMSSCPETTADICSAPARNVVSWGSIPFFLKKPASIA
jgi:hypothetical protein